jgi:DNA-binding response OmpR family regulator
MIDDDAKLNRLVKEYLNQFDFETVTATHPAEGMKMLERLSPDLVILDVMLPDMDGFEVCKKIRQNRSLPIIMLTARGEVADRIVGLELGADDYLPKPFEPRELAARIQSILRRVKTETPEDAMAFGSLLVDFARREATIDGHLVDLTTNEFMALALLAKNAGRVLNRDQILEYLRGMECDAFNRSVDITISRLRQKLNDDPKNPSFIKTIWGAGYVFIGANNSE